MPDAPLRFTATVVPGRGRGKGLGSPTLNLSLEDVPPNLTDGVYACFAILDAGPEQAVMHLGPRPTFGDTRTCEVHLLDRTLASPPSSVSVEVMGFLRKVRTFASDRELREQIQNDIVAARGIMTAHV